MAAAVARGRRQLAAWARGVGGGRPGRIDMRMSAGDGETVRRLIERLDPDGLAELLRALGGERRARRVFRCIKQELDAGRLVTIRDLRSDEPQQTVGRDDLVAELRKRLQ